MRSASVIALIGIASLLALACGDDDDINPYEFVGSACRADIDCVRGAHCEMGGDFPDGTCTSACRNHNECPIGSACVEVRGGICLVACGSDPYCRPGYRCRERNDHGDPGESRVCLK